MTWGYHNSRKEWVPKTIECISAQDIVSEQAAMISNGGVITSRKP